MTISSCLRKFKHIVGFICLAVTLAYFSLQLFLNQFHASSLTSPPFHPPFGQNTYHHRLSPSPIQLGLVVCRGNKNTTAEIVEQVDTLVKSVLISTKIHNSSNKIMFHIFTDSNPLRNTLHAGLEDYRVSMERFVRFTVVFYNVSTLVPKKYLEGSLNSLEKLDCLSAQLLFPDVLPDLEEILYLDTDVLISGNIVQIWEQFRNTKDKEIITLVPNNEPSDTNFGYVDNYWFDNIPHVPPKGVNTGVMYMNLTGLRVFNWSDHVFKHFKQAMEGPNVTLAMLNQRIINMILYYNPNHLKLLPCPYNFQRMHCEKGLTCQDAVGDPVGIQIFHGAGEIFQNSSRSYYSIYRAYKKFNFKKHKIIEDLMKPLKTLFMEINNVHTCEGVLGPLLFKDLLGNYNPEEFDEDLYENSIDYV